MSLKFRFENSKKTLRESFGEKEEVVARAATAAIAEAASFLKTAGRAAIAAGGFGVRWQRTLRVERYPTRGRTSINAAAFVWHKIPYAGVFQTGARILGQPTLWLPLPGAPKRAGRKAMNPKNLEAATGKKLVYFKTPGGTPILGARVRVEAMKGRRRKNKKITISNLRRGESGEGSLTTIPLFVGVRSVNLPKKFDVISVCVRARDSLPSLYAKHLKDDD